MQSWIVDFEFLNYLEANPGLLVQELINVFRYVYPDQEEEEEEENIGEVLSIKAENMQNARPSEVGEVETTEQVAQEIPTEVNAEEEEIGGKVQEEKEAANEDPGNAGEV